VSIFKDAQVLGLGGIGGADLGRPNGEVCLSQTAAREEFLI
jgi:hypothetical protein